MNEVSFFFVVFLWFMKTVKFFDVENFRVWGLILLRSPLGK